jgi:hypothetical protein
MTAREEVTGIQDAGIGSIPHHRAQAAQVTVRRERMDQ